MTQILARSARGLLVVVVFLPEPLLELRIGFLLGGLAQALARRCRRRCRSPVLVTRAAAAAGALAAPSPSPEPSGIAVARCSRCSAVLAELADFRSPLRAARRAAAAAAVAAAVRADRRSSPSPSALPRASRSLATRSCSFFSVLSKSPSESSRPSRPTCAARRRSARHRPDLRATRCPASPSFRTPSSLELEPLGAARTALAVAGFAGSPGVRWRCRRRRRACPAFRGIPGCRRALPPGIPPLPPGIPPGMPPLLPPGIPPPPPPPASPPPPPPGWAFRRRARHAAAAAGGRAAREHDRGDRRETAMK